MGINAIEIKKVPEELFEKVCSIKINLKHWLLSEHLHLQVEQQAKWQWLLSTLLIK